MSSITKNDKQTWENYIANFNSFSINLKNHKKNFEKKIKDQNPNWTLVETKSF